jgi:Sulfatase
VVVLTLSSSASQNPAPAFAVRQEGFRSFPVVLVVFDELPGASLMNRRGRIDSRLFPNFARLARDSTWFRNTTTIKGFTKEALPALATGRYPEHDGLPAAHRELNVFSLLGGAFEIRTADRLPALCPRELCPSGVEPRSSASLACFSAFGRGNRGAHLLSFLDLVRSGREPRFYFLHLVMPHSPWRYLPSGQRYEETEPMPGEVDAPGRGKAWAPDRWLVAQGLQRHLLQLQLTDRVLGALIDKLHAMGLYERALVIVMADHGEGFAPGRPKRLLSRATLGHIAEVPLFVRRPLQVRGHVSDMPVETVDVIPTIADVLNLSTILPDLDGTSVFHGSITRDRVRTIEGFGLDPRGTEKYDLIDLKYSTFPSGRAGLDLFGLAPGRREGLIGRSVEELSLLTQGSATVTVADAPSIAAAHPSADLFPSLLMGTVEGLSGRRAIIAAAINGRIAALTRTSYVGGEARFSCLLSPAFFEAPPNRLELFEVLGSYPETLVPLPLVPGS